MATRAGDVYEATLAVFDESADPQEPRTTTEVAAELDCGRRGAYKRLETLVDRGELETKKVGASGRVWWRPGAAASDLGDELARYRRLFDALGDPVYELDAAGRFTYVNDAAVELSGYDADELLGSSVAIGMSEATIERVTSIIGDLLVNETADSFTVEYEAIPKDGDPIPVENHIALRRDEEGTFQGTTGVIRDISERRARETEIDRTQNLLRNAERMGKVGGWELDVASDAVTWTEGTRRIHEVDDVEFDPELGDGLDFYHPDDRAVMASRIERCIDAGEPYSEDLRLVTAAGNERWVRAAGEALVEDGETHTVRGYIQDITDRVERERELQRTTDLLEHAEELANVGGWELDVSEPPYESVWTDELFEIFEMEPRASVTPKAVLEAVHPEDRARVEQVMDAYLDGEQRLETEFRICPDEETVKWLRVFSERAAGTDDVVRGAMLDITDQKTRERDLERERASLAALNSLHETVRKITEAVVDGSTRGEIERAAADQLAASDSYSFAWVADVDPRTGMVTPRVEAGVDGYLDRARIAVDSSSRRGGGPGGRAIATQEMQVSRNVFEDPTFEPWRVLAEEYGYTSVAAIPVCYEGTLYGLVGLYSDRQDAFGETERRVVGQLGEVLGHAIAAVERKRALLSDDVVEITLRDRTRFERPSLPDPGEGTVTFDRTIPLDADRYLVYGRATGDAVDIMEGLVASPADPHWEAIEVIGTESRTTRIQATLADPPVLGPVARHGGRISEATFDDGILLLELSLPADADTQLVVDRLSERSPEIEMLARRQTTGRTADGVAESALTERLTDRQRAALEASYYAGYFDWPRENSGEDVAASLGIGSSTFHQHIRRAQKQVFEGLLGDE
ncbi:PAS domain S-box protein [Halomicroarcula sp. GCM10025817]|uniref:PAS domain S-box protein n=1 Tax=Haloarcula TaxID=2237 RepID=UPI0023E8F8E9|nr:PAS domain S-box protein [Halomicroarcula sp. SYNS111]